MFIILFKLVFWVSIISTSSCETGSIFFCYIVIVWDFIIKHTVIWEVIRKHEKYKKHNIKINKVNYEVIINVRIDKQNIYVIEVVGCCCKCRNERKDDIKI